MASRWSDTPCRHYFPVDDGDTECATCGWAEDEHGGTGRHHMDTPTQSETLDQILALLQDIVERLDELEEKILNISLPDPYNPL
jgi:hypothetical protein